MSRSYKKFPVIKDRARTSKDCLKPKTYANHVVRRCKEIPSGKSGFKKVYEKWDISDYRFIGYMSEPEVRKQWETHDYIYYDTYEEALQDWKKYYIRK